MLTVHFLFHPKQYVRTTLGVIGRVLEMKVDQDGKNKVLVETMVAGAQNSDWYDESDLSAA